MNKDEYVIINKTTIQKRIEKLQKIDEKEIWEHMEFDTLKHILSQSSPLISEIEKAFDEGKSVGILSYQPQGHTLDKELYNERKQNYISNLKLDI